ncbi:hypothetical protein [Sporosarcina sp. JAI121]|uniref:hypothetical protein n=1 Tax=Sporosarcina sp. JAI121 TaxID=2723064 RepID=UPI0015C9AC52|nr:hypothetical protein [Sporosarcina sp. JAI121]NYF26171.1 hypothetical protein [Sporosarcina sp. JAI121]
MRQSQETLRQPSNWTTDLEYFTTERRNCATESGNSTTADKLDDRLGVLYDRTAELDDRLSILYDSRQTGRQTLKTLRQNGGTVRQSQETLRQPANWTTDYM